MANLKEIRIRITSVGSTMQITSAMKMVSAAKLKRAQDAVTQMRPYANKLTELLVNLSSTLDSSDPLEFNDKKSYKERLKQAQKKTDLIDGTIAGQATINSIPVSIAIMNFEFMGGSMGVVTGEKISRVLEVALEKRIPAIVVSSSGGARMQEGILSLMQMAKTSAVISKLKEENIPYISVLTDPTTGGCAASFAMLGDINIAEPKALIGFAGPRVIEQSIKQILPEGFQTSEFLLEHGFIDRIIHRLKMKEELTSIIKMFTNND